MLSLNKKNKTILKAETKPKKNRDILLKIISVFTAFVIWFIIIGYESPESEQKFTSIPVQLKNVDLMESRYGFSVIVDKEITIDVTLTGKKNVLNKLKKSEINAYVDLADVKKSGEEISLPIEVKEIENITVIEMSSMNAQIYIDKKTSKPVPVVGEIKKSMTESGVTIGKLEFKPAEINISGPEGILEKIVSAQVNLYLESDKNIRKSLVVTEEYILIDKDGNEVKNNYIKAEDTTIEIFIPVTTTKEVPLTLAYKYGYFNSANSKITITPSHIKIKGSPDLLSTINSIEFGLIDEKKIESDKSLKINISMPDGVENISGITTADVDIAFINSQVNTINLPQELYKIIAPPEHQFHINEGMLQIKVRGPSVNLQYINQNSISALIDLSNLTEPGNFSIPVEVAVKNDPNVYCVGEYVVNVEVY